MADDQLSELDALIESDVLEALGEKVSEDTPNTQEIDGITIEDMEETVVDEETPEENLEDISLDEENENNNEVEEDQDSSLEESAPVVEEDVAKEDLPLEQPEENTQNVQTVNSTDLASLLSELLNNKTIEITIKIKE